MSEDEAGGEQMDLDSLLSRVKELEAELVTTRKRAERAKKGFKRKSITKPACAEDEETTRHTCEGSKGSRGERAQSHR